MFTWLPLIYFIHCTLLGSGPFTLQLIVTLLPILPLTPGPIVTVNSPEIKVKKHVSVTLNG